MPQDTNRRQYFPCQPPRSASKQHLAGPQVRSSSDGLPSKLRDRNALCTKHRPEPRQREYRNGHDIKTARIAHIGCGYPNGRGGSPEPSAVSNPTTQLSGHTTLAADTTFDVKRNQLRDRANHKSLNKTLQDAAQTGSFVERRRCRLVAVITASIPYDRQQRHAPPTSCCKPPGTR